MGCLKQKNRERERQRERETDRERGKERQTGRQKDAEGTSERKGGGRVAETQGAGGRSSQKKEGPRQIGGTAGRTVPQAGSGWPGCACEAGTGGVAAPRILGNGVCPPLDALSPPQRWRGGGPRDRMHREVRDPGQARLRPVPGRVLASLGREPGLPVHLAGGAGQWAQGGGGPGGELQAWRGARRPGSPGLGLRGGVARPGTGTGTGTGSGTPVPPRPAGPGTCGRGRSGGGSGGVGGGAPKRVGVGAARKSLQHPVFPGGLPSKY